MPLPPSIRYVPAGGDEIDCIFVFRGKKITITIQPFTPRTCDLYDLPVWSICMIYLYDLSAWSICMIYLYDLSFQVTISAWSTCMIYLYDLSAWSICVIYLYDLPVWSIRVIYLYDLSVWSICMIYLYDLFLFHDLDISGQIYSRSVWSVWSSSCCRRAGQIVSWSCMIYAVFHGLDLY